MNDEYLARPIEETDDPRLSTHLESVAEIISTTAPTGVIQEAALIAGRFHDFGKYTEWFQEYVRMSEAQRRAMTAAEERRKRHSLLGAFATLYVLEQREVPSAVAVPAFLAVAKHHGRLGDVETMLDSYTNRDYEQTRSDYKRIGDQTENVLRTAATPTGEVFDEVLDSGGGLIDFAKYINTQQPLQTLTNYTVTPETYQRLLHLWGLLTYADKLDSSDLTDPAPELEPLNPDAITDHVESLDAAETEIQSELNDYREEARTTALDRVDVWQAADSNFATLTLPTGFGKTLTGLQAALKRASQKESRVIYALPYTSIIDQTDSIVRSVFGYAPTDPEYTNHHHQSETRSLTEAADELDLQELLAEMWRSNITLTTFVQVFESLAGPSNRQSIKLPSLQDAVLLLDEPQAIPYKWWHFIARIATILDKEFNAEIILMTATQPRILQHLPYTDAPFSLLDNSKSYYQFLETTPRVRYDLHPTVERYLENPTDSNELSIQEAAARLATDEANSILAICNTITSTSSLSQALQTELENPLSLNATLDKLYDQLPSAEALHDTTLATLHRIARQHSGAIVVTLTTRLRPIDRTVLLSCIRGLLADDAVSSLHVVSTQLVEAGVDVSFETLYRDLGPLPSLVQAAGRCNRSFEGTPQPVTVWRLAGDNENQAPSDLIYEDTYDLLRPTRETLRELAENGRISEYQMIYEGTRMYYDRLHHGTRPGDRALARHINTGEFKALGKERMISNDYPTVDVVIARTDNERSLYTYYCEYCKEHNFERASLIWDVLTQRTISVPINEEGLQDIPLIQVPERDDTFFVDAKAGKGLYDLDTANGVQDNGVEYQFLV